MEMMLTWEENQLLINLRIFQNKQEPLVLEIYLVEPIYEQENLSNVKLIKINLLGNISIV